MTKLLGSFAFSLLLSLCACQRAPAEVTVENPWAAASPNGATVAAGYLTIRNTTDTADTFTGASSPRAGQVQLHQMRMQGSIMEMRPLNALAVPAHGEVTFSPGGYHLMFEDINAPFVAGERVSATLTFAHHAPIHVVIPVRDRSDMGDGM